MQAVSRHWTHCVRWLPKSPAGSSPWTLLSWLRMTPGRSLSSEMARSQACLHGQMCSSSMRLLRSISADNTEEIVLVDGSNVRAMRAVNALRPPREQRGQPDKITTVTEFDNTLRLDVL